MSTHTRTRFSLVVAALCACLALVAAPASAQTDITGTWEVTMNTPQGANTVDVTFKQAGEAITGELTSPLGTAPFKGTFIKDALMVVAAIDVQGTALELTFNAKVTGDTLAGTVKLGDFGDAPIEGKRKAGGAAPATAAAAPAAAPAAAASSSAATGAGVSGNWTINVNVQGQEIPLTGTFVQDASNKITGSLSSPQGEMAVAGTMTGNTLKLEFMAPGDMAVTMTGDLTAAGLKGKLSVVGFGDGDWVGTRAK